MEKPSIALLLFSFLLFLVLGIFVGYSYGVDKYDSYYYYYISQYPSLDTINHIQDMSNENL